MPFEYRPGDETGNIANYWADSFYRVESAWIDATADEKSVSDFKVNRVGVGGNVSPSRKTEKKGSSDSSFADALMETADTGATGKTASVQGVTNVGSVIAVQEVEDATSGRSRGLLISYGEELLDKLEEIRLEILMGAVSKDRLADLAQQMRRKRSQIDDPQLNSLIDDIELRAEVEIAKLTRVV